MAYTIEVKTIEPIRVAYLNYQGDSRKVNKVFPTVFKSIQGKANGAPFFEFLEMNPDTKIGRLELCVPTAETPTNLEVQVKEFPVYQALCTTHFGGYDSMMRAYEELRRYAEMNQISLDTTFREIYIKGAGAILKGNPEKYITDIIIPIVEGR